MASPFTTYKLIILYMLQNSEGDLTNSQITDFILDRKYTNYFQLQQAVSELVEADLVEMSSQSNRTYYRLTEEGKNTLNIFPENSLLTLRKKSRNISIPCTAKLRNIFSLLRIITPPRRAVTLSACGLSKAVSVLLISASKFPILLRPSPYVKAGLINIRTSTTK